MIYFWSRPASQEFYSNFNASIKRIFEQSFEISNETRLWPFLFPFQKKKKEKLKTSRVLASFFQMLVTPRGTILFLTSNAKFMEIHWSKKSCNLCRTNLRVHAVVRYSVLLRFLLNPVFSISVLSQPSFTSFHNSKFFIHFLFFFLSIFRDIYSIVSYLAVQRLNLECTL